MTEKEIISYLKTLTDSSWRMPVTTKWNLKDVVAHMVGWTELDVTSLEKIHETEILPWREKGFDVNKYNDQSVEKYSKTKPNSLLDIWNRLLDRREELVENLGKEAIKEDKELFYYLFENGNSNHTLHHYQQIEKAFSKIIPKS